MEQARDRKTTAGPLLRLGGAHHIKPEPPAEDCRAKRWLFSQRSYPSKMFVRTVNRPTSHAGWKNLQAQNFNAE
jgi:hypothetical protein